jgi:hypothetical protein
VVMRMIGDVTRDVVLGALAWRAGYRLQACGASGKPERLKIGLPAIRDGSVALKRPASVVRRGWCSSYVSDGRCRAPPRCRLRVPPKAPVRKTRKTARFVFVVAEC